MYLSAFLFAAASLLATEVALSPCEPGEHIAASPATERRAETVEDTNAAQQSRSKSPVVTLPSNVIRVPLTRQATSYTCGVSALQSVLGYWGEAHREDELAKACKSNYQQGTAYQRIAKYAQSQGFKVDIRKQMKLQELKALLDQKLPVICLIQAWPERSVDYAKDWEDGHYVVAIGYDDSRMYFMDPSTLGNYTYIPTSQFEQRWHDTDGKERLFNFGMIISKERSNFDAESVTLLE